MKLTLYIACSKSKSTDDFDCLVPAIDLYTGLLFRQGVALAKKNEWNVVILSAKYGFIGPNKLIQTYDLKMKTPALTGAYPLEGGFYLGGSVYFANAPENILPLIPKLPYGAMGVALDDMLLGNVTRDALFSKPAGPGVVRTLYDILFHTAMNKEQLYQELSNRLGERSSMRKTINAQLNPNRMAKEKSVQFLIVDGVYKITDSVHYYTKTTR